MYSAGPGTAKFGVGDVNVMSGEDENLSQSQGMRVDELRAVIIMNAHCHIQMANKGEAGNSKYVASPVLGVCCPRFF